MAKLQQLFGLVLVGATAAQVSAFEFDRPGEGMGTATTPVGQLAWEQGLPSVNYQEDSINGQKVKTTRLNADVLLRTGLTDNLELQLGWDGPTWTQTKVQGQRVEDDGLGDVSIGLKHAVDLGRDKLSMAVLAEAVLATGQSGFSQEEDSYAVASAVSYEFDDNVSTNITMRYEWQDGDWTLVAIPGLGYRFNDRWSGFSEFAYSKTEGQDYESLLNTGVIYAVSERVQLDASLGVHADRGAKQYTSGLGVSVLF